MPRGAFGVRKKYGAVRFSSRSTFWASTSLQDYLEWLRERRGAWIRRGKLPPVAVSRLVRMLQPPAAGTARVLAPWRNRFRPVRRLVRGLEFLASREYLYKFMFPWALERAKERYPSWR